MPIGLIYSMCREEKQMFNISLRKPDCAVRKTLMWVMQTPSLCKYNFSSPNYKKNEAFSEWRVLFTFLMIWDCFSSLIFMLTRSLLMFICTYVYTCTYVFISWQLSFFSQHVCSRQLHLAWLLLYWCFIYSLSRSYICMTHVEHFLSKGFDWLNMLLYVNTS